MKFLEERKTIRKYADKKIDRTLLERLFDAAARSSTTGNMQLYSVVVTEDEDEKKTLSPIHFNQPMVTQAPVVLTFCADFNRFNKWCENRKAEPGYANFQSFITAMIDTVIFAQTFCVAAERSGLGICYIGTTTYNPDKLIDVLKLPKHVVPIITLTVGYPAHDPAPVDRLPVESFVHYSRYEDYTPETIDRLYAYKESLPESRKFIEENAKETLAQVFTDIRYTKKDNEHFSEVLLNVLRQQGF